jgi:hypothetical protein
MLFAIGSFLTRRRLRQRACAYLEIVALLLLFWVSFSAPASAQIGGLTGGWVVQLIGIVQVEPGSNVLTLGVKDETIRFAVHDVLSADRNFSVPQFLAESRRRDPSLDIRGQDFLLDMLIQERPGKRVLKLTGRIYQDSRRFVLDSINRLEDRPKPQ